MTQRYGIDTSVLVRLITGQPPDGFDYCVQHLRELVEMGAEIFASNQVVVEAYVAVQHHYGVTKADTRAALLGALKSGLVSPLNGQSVLDALRASGSPGLFDRLIIDDYSRSGLKTLTLDGKMSNLSDARHL